MEYARRMALFLRVWREEWLGATRAQLAAAVAAACPGSKPVTPDMVEAWEQGQPPKTAAQLMALVKVMKARGIDGGGAQEFMRAAIRACGERQYPELLPREDFAGRPDVEGLAREAYAGWVARGRKRPGVVTLLTRAQDLEAALWGRNARPVAGAQRRAQQAALAYTRAALGYFLAGSWSLVIPHASRAFASNARFINAAFGPGGLGGELTVIGQRALEMHHRAHAGRSPQAAARLLELSEAATARGEKAVAARAYLRALHCCAELLLGGSGLSESRARQQLDVVAEADPRDAGWAPHFDLVWMGLSLGDEALALRMLEEFEAWFSLPAPSHVQFREARGWLAVAHDDLPTAASVLGNAVVEECQDLSRRGIRLTYCEHLRRGGQRRGGVVR